MKRVFALSLLALLLAACGAQTTEPTVTVDSQDDELQSTIEALKTQLAALPEQGTATPFECHNSIVAWNLWGGIWYLVAPELGVTADDDVVVIMDLDCENNVSFSFVSPDLPKTSNGFTVALAMSNDGLKTESCRVYRHFVDAEGKTWDNSWNCNMRMKNERATLICGSYQKPENIYTLSLGRESELDDLNGCR